MILSVKKMGNIMKKLIKDKEIVFSEKQQQFIDNIKIKQLKND